MKIEYYKDNTKIIDSYKVQNRKSIENTVIYILEVRKSMRYPITRSINSYVNEWLGHNYLFRKNYKIDHSKDVDLEERITLIQKIKGIFMDFIWLIIGR